MKQNFTKHSNHQVVTKIYKHQKTATRIMDRKGQGLSLNFIIIGIIALLVVVIVVAVFTGFFGSFGRTATDCSTIGGTCTTGNSCGKDVFDRDIKELPRGKCEGTGKTCCQAGLERQTEGGGADNPNTPDAQTFDTLRGLVGE